MLFMLLICRKTLFHTIILDKHANNIREPKFLPLTPDLFRKNIESFRPVIPDHFKLWPSSNFHTIFYAYILLLIFSGHLWSIVGLFKTILNKRSVMSSQLKKCIPSLKDVWEIFRDLQVSKFAGVFSISVLEQNLMEFKISCLNAANSEMLITIGAILRFLSWIEVLETASMCCSNNEYKASN